MKNETIKNTHIHTHEFLLLFHSRISSFYIYIYISESMGGYSVSMVGELQRVNEREIYIY